MLPKSLPCSAGPQVNIEEACTANQLRKHLSLDGIKVSLVEDARQVSGGAFRA